MVLGISTIDRIDSEAGFTDLGIDSLTAVELRNRLQTSLQQPLPATLIYDYPTLATLTRYLMDRLIPLSKNPTPQAPNASSPVHAENISLEVDSSLDNLSESELEFLLLEELDKLED